MSWFWFRGSIQVSPATAPQAPDAFTRGNTPAVFSLTGNADLSHFAHARGKRMHTAPASVAAGVSRFRNLAVYLSGLALLAYCRATRTGKYLPLMLPSAGQRCIIPALFNGTGRIATAAGSSLTR